MYELFRLNFNFVIFIAYKLVFVMKKKKLNKVILDILLVYYTKHIF